MRCKKNKLENIVNYLKRLSCVFLVLIFLGLVFASECGNGICESGENDGSCEDCEEGEVSSDDMVGLDYVGVEEELSDTFGKEDVENNVNTPTENPDDSSNSNLIILIIAGGVFVIVIIVLVVLLTRKKKGVSTEQGSVSVQPTTSNSNQSVGYSANV